MTLWMVCICPEGAMFKIWLKSVEFEGIKNTLKDGWHCWRFGGCWRFLTGADVLDQDKDVSFKVQWVFISNFVKMWCLEAEVWSVQFCFGEISEVEDQPRQINWSCLLCRQQSSTVTLVPSPLALGQGCSASQPMQPPKCVVRVFDTLASAWLGYPGELWSRLGYLKVAQYVWLD